MSDSNDQQSHPFFQANFNELNRTLSSFVSQSDKESRVEKSRRILGEVASGLSDNDLQIFITEIQYLISSWFDNYEQQIFKGQTLRQILNGG